MSKWKSLISCSPRPLREHRTNNTIGKLKFFVVYDTIRHTKRCHILIFNETGKLTMFAPYSLQCLKELVTYMDEYNPIIIRDDRPQLWINPKTHKIMLENRKKYKAEEHAKYVLKIRARYDRNHEKPRHDRA